LLRLIGAMAQQGRTNARKLVALAFEVAVVLLLAACGIWFENGRSCALPFVSGGSQNTHRLCRPSVRIVRAALAPFAAGPLEAVQRWSFKRELLELLDGCERGTLTSEGQKAEINRLVEALVQLNPTEKAAARLSGRWKLLWTTEKETLSLVSNGVLGRAVTDVFQLIDVQAGTLSNNIAFEDGAFEVESTCEPSKGIRVDFAFTAARVSFGDLTVPLPPVGKGWFDCVYLDDELRIVRDSRDDSLIAMRQR